MERYEHFAKRIRIMAAVLLSFACAVLFSACSRDGIVSVSVSGPTEILVGDFEYSDYTVEVTRASGSTEKVSLTREMLSDADNLKFFANGEQTLTVNYGGKSCELRITVCLYEFEDLRFDDVTAVYNGEYVTAEVFENYPAGTEVYYRNGNRFINAGEYEVTATVSARNYVTQTLTAKVVIKRAEYDMSGVSFDADTLAFEYDGGEHTARISGTLPEGISVSYPDRNNVRTDAGIYTVTARFSSTNGNYLPIEDMTAQMVIAKKKYKTETLAFRDAEVTYDGLAHSVSVENLPEGVGVKYSVTKDGEAVSGTEFGNAGIYCYTATFLSDNANYEEIPPMTATLTVSPAVYDVAKIRLDGKSVSYDGEAHTPVPCRADGTEGLPDGLEVAECWFEKNGERLYIDDDEKKGYLTEVTDIGVYRYCLRLKDPDGNYESFVLYAYLTIK